LFSSRFNAPCICRKIRCDRRTVFGKAEQVPAAVAVGEGTISADPVDPRSRQAREEVFGGIEDTR
jgi:hypothetical protein